MIMAVMGKHIYYRQYVMTLQIKANPQFIYLYKKLQAQTSLLSGVEGLDLICIDDVHLISNHKEWELALLI